MTFKDYLGEVVVDLGSDWSEKNLIGEKEAVLIGIDKLKAGLGRAKFKGSSADETLMAGQGYGSIYGDGGENLLIGYDREANGDKEGSTTFMVLGHAAGAEDVIRGFEFVEDDNYTDTKKVTADEIEVDLNTNHIKKVSVDGEDVIFVVENNSTGTTETATVEGGLGKDIRFNNIGGGRDIIAQVGTDSVNFDKYANYYNAQEKDAVVVIDGQLDEAVVWLDGSKGVDFIGDFKTIDATGKKAKAQLAGNDADNEIYAGDGETSLWGGHGGNDVLIGGTAKNTFFYAHGNGEDTIQGAKTDDVVNFADNTLDQIATTEIGATSIALNFKDGGKLIVNDSGAAVAFKVQGDTYFANRENNSWTKKL